MRLDEALVERQLAPSRARGRDAVLRGRVTVDGRPVSKPGMAVAPGAAIEVDDPALAWVSRGALKLIAGLDAFAIDPAGRVCIDLGASTGGFTQVLLSRGAARVYAVDVGHGQLAPEIASETRVIALEGLNARDLTHEHIPEPVDLSVADVSFVSLKLVLPAALELAGHGARLVALVKPQFEVGRAGLGKGGIVRDAGLARAAAEDVGHWLEARGWTVLGLVDSPLAGGSGNREFLLAARRD